MNPAPFAIDSCHSPRCGRLSQLWGGVPHETHCARSGAACVAEYTGLGTAAAVAGTRKRLARFPNLVGDHNRRRLAFCASQAVVQVGDFCTGVLKKVEMLRNLPISFLVFVSISLIGPVADGAFINPPYSRCETVVNQRLDQIKVDRTDIRKIFYTRQHRSGGGDNGDRVVGTDAWVQFHSCKGYLVIDLNNSCRVRQVYTRGQCKIPGI